MKYTFACYNGQFGNCHKEDPKQRGPAAIVSMMWECIRAHLEILQHLVDFHGVHLGIIPSYTVPSCLGS